MGYNLHITRRENWADEDGPEISLDEWLGYRVNDTELAQDPENDDPTNTIILTHPQQWPLWWRRGEVYTENPDKAVIAKMVQIASALNARVLGDNDEIYDTNVSQSSKSAPHLAMTRVTETPARDSPNRNYFDQLDRFTLHGGCVFLLVVVGGSGGITAYLIYWLVPWALDLPLPYWLYIPFAGVGLAGPLTAFLVLCKYSLAARRFFFAPTDDGLPSTGVKEPDTSSGAQRPPSLLR